jgi:SNF2 family DNA or RNA helicase
LPFDGLQPIDYEFGTKPFLHQALELSYSCELPYRGLLWEQGCAKTKPIIDNAAYLYEKDKIDCLLVVAPNGVHRNWVNDEIPLHLPPRLKDATHCFYWQSQKSKTKWHERAAKAAVEHKGLLVVTMAYDAFMTEAGKAFVWKILRKRRCMYVCDEAHNIMTPSAKRTISVVKSGKWAAYRRILTGTPISKSPFNIYSQVRFLDPEFWIRNGVGFTFAEFKSYFGVWRTREECVKEFGFDPGYDELLEYRNLDKLQALLKSISSRVLKIDVLDLPPKIYGKRYFDLNPVQRKAYEQLKAEFVAEISEGRVVDGSLAIVRLLRLQQIACGYAVTDDEEPDILLGDSNPRMDLLEEVVDSTEGAKCIIWARFRKDIDQIMDRLNKGVKPGRTPKAVRYDGKATDDEKEWAKNEFQKGDVTYFVGNQEVGSEGLTLTAAHNVIYYSNSFKLIKRLQSEDRPHRAGLDHPVNYYDLCANDTVDQRLIHVLRANLEVSNMVTGDQWREWL